MDGGDNLFVVVLFECLVYVMGVEGEGMDCDFV